MYINQMVATTGTLIREVASPRLTPPPPLPFFLSFFKYMIVLYRQKRGRNKVLAYDIMDAIVIYFIIH